MTLHAARLPNSCGIGFTTCGASRNSTSTPCALSSANQPDSRADVVCMQNGFNGSCPTPTGEGASLPEADLN